MNVNLYYKMTFGRIIDGIEYMYLMNDNDFKKKSLYDNVYFTLRDIFANAESTDTVFEANSFNHSLTDGVCFEDRTESFQYTNVLHQKDYVDRLQYWLKYFNIYYFEFIEPEEDEEIDMKDYMKFNDWWDEFKELRKLIDKQYEKCCKWEEEDVQRDCDKQGELSNN